MERDGPAGNPYQMLEINKNILTIHDKIIDQFHNSVQLEENKNVYIYNNLWEGDQCAKISLEITFWKLSFQFPGEGLQVKSFVSGNPARADTK